MLGPTCHSLHCQFLEPAAGSCPASCGQVNTYPRIMSITERLYDLCGHCMSEIIPPRCRSVLEECIKLSVNINVIARGLRERGGGGGGDRCPHEDSRQRAGCRRLVHPLQPGTAPAACFCRNVAPNVNAIMYVKDGGCCVCVCVCVGGEGGGESTPDAILPH